jgi:hypothetical protein
MKKIELWQEGFKATGQSSTAGKVGEYLAKDFEDSMNQYMAKNPNLAINKYGTSSGEYSNWGMRIYDNEADARKYFG